MWIKKTWQDRSGKKRRLVFFFRLTSQRKEQMIHSKIYQSHDAFQSTAILDKAKQDLCYSKFLSNQAHHLFHLFIALLRVHTIIRAVVKYHRNAIPRTLTLRPMSV